MTRYVDEQRGWIAGEVAPAYRARTDLAALRFAAAKLENLVVEPGGSLRRRPGTKLLFSDDVPQRIIPPPARAHHASARSPRSTARAPAATATSSR